MAKKMIVNSNYEVDVKEMVEKEIHKALQDLIVKLSMEHKRNINVTVKVDVE